MVNSELQGAYRSAVMLHVPNAQDIDNLSLSTAVDQLKCVVLQVATSVSCTAV
jgi:hypothetical protein